MKNICERLLLLFIQCKSFKTEGDYSAFPVFLWCSLKNETTKWRELIQTITTFTEIRWEVLKSSTLSTQYLKMWDALCDLVPFVRFKKCEEHPWLQPAILLNVTLLHGCFHVFIIEQMVTNRAKDHILPKRRLRIRFWQGLSN